MQGFGFYFFGDGKTYQGYYHKDKKHGYGIYSWVDGKQYHGWWTQGKQHGYGIFIQGSSTKYGSWFEGKKENWLDEEQVNQIRKEQQKSETDLKLKKSEKERMTFERPKDFDKKAREVKDKI